MLINPEDFKMDFNAAAADAGKFVKFTDLLEPWMREHVRPFLEELMFAGKVDEAMKISTAMTEAFNGLPAMLVNATDTDNNTNNRAYIDTRKDMTFEQMWANLVVSAQNPVLLKTVNDVADIAEAIEPGQKVKIVGGFNAVADAAPAFDITAKDGSVRDFLSVFHEKNPFKVQDLRKNKP